MKQDVASNTKEQGASASSSSSNSGGTGGCANVNPEPASSESLEGSATTVGQSSLQSSGATRSEAVKDDAALAQLVEMGFPIESGRAALTRAGGDMTAALEALCQSQGLDEV